MPPSRRRRDRERERTDMEEDERSASDLFKDAQALTAELKNLLRSIPPWAREADAVRSKARDTYLAVVFHHPLSPQAQSLDSLWLGTTYTLISAYRDIVARIEAALSTKPDAAGDLKRTLAKFRSSLVAEDTFYRSLVSRIVAFYKLHQRAGPSLSLLGIAADDGSDGCPTLSREEEEKKLQLVYKGLICLGDLERYKEQYTERARRDAREGVAPKAERFDKAIMYYEVARGLQPDNGTAFNQLAVIDGYVGQAFNCTYHYYRALAVRQPFPSGDVNLERMLKRAFDRWRAGGGAEKGEGEADRFRRDLLSACAILHLRAGTSHFTALHTEVIGNFGTLIHARQLPSEVIVKTTAMVISEHWCARLGKAEKGEDEEKARRRRHVEELALKFILGIFGTLMRTAETEVTESLAAHKNADDSAVAEDDEVTDTTLALAQRITAVLRRILPSLRIMSRWLKGHIEYIGRLAGKADVRAFWAQYKTLMLSLARLFPLIQLPSLESPLEEDIDMRGFLPLRRSISEESGEVMEQQDVHPNEEQLMRIADLLVDVKLIMQIEAGAAALSDGPQLPAQLFGHTTDETASVSASTEDDPVNLAMRATLNENSSVADDEEEEVIMWERTPVVPGTEQTATAQDLLQNLTLAAPPPSGLLFGDSIWSMSREESQKGVSRAAAAAWHSQDDTTPPQQQQPQVPQQHAQWQHAQSQHPSQSQHYQPNQQQRMPSQAQAPSHPGYQQPQHHQQPHPQHQPHHQPPPPPPGFAPPPGFGAPGNPTPPGFTTPPFSTPPQQWPRSRPQSGANIWGAAPPERENWGAYQPQSRQWGYQ